MGATSHHVTVAHQADELSPDRAEGVKVTSSIALAPAEQHPRLLVGQRGGDLGGEAALADARLAPDEDRRAATSPADPRDGMPDSAEFAISAHERRATHRPQGRRQIRLGLEKRAPDRRRLDRRDLGEDLGMGSLGLGRRLDAQLVTQLLAATLVRMERLCPIAFGRVGMHQMPERRLAERLDRECRLGRLDRLDRMPGGEGGSGHEVQSP
jgi:hypothetical protein